MCALLPAWTCLLLGLLPLETQTRSPLSHHSLQTSRHKSPRSSKHVSPSFTMPPTSHQSVALDNSITLGESTFIWRVLLKKGPPPRFLELEEEMWPGARGRSRGRRHAGGRRAHGHLMRAGCVLGTCQVQNLSHRLYQLIGRSGREDSSPVNPRSPHSYG
ncbi:protein ADM2 [Syngnathoides biaculeatus]|uniref:protein ADM2 n=1 Tax=Syngnathoides biaculeatus TaxID=300417 RepID=UPI002ADD46A2|nr:protein ADM2 [Syngnathoides biaculeatus]